MQRKNKTVKVVTVLLAIMLGIAMLAGCSGNGDNGGSSATMDMQATIEKYSLDTESGEWQNMSSDRMPQAKLVEVYEAAKNAGASYEEKVALVGCEPSSFRKEGESRSFRWDTEESEYTYLVILFKEENGKWVSSFASKTNM